MDITNLAIIVVVPLLIALIVCTIMKSKMKTARIARTADNYIPQGGFNLVEQTDVFLYRTTTRQRIEQNTSSSSGGGGSGGSGGFGGFSVGGGGGGGGFSGGGGGRR